MALILDRRVYLLLALITSLARAPVADAQEQSAPTLNDVANATFRGIYEDPVTLLFGVWEGESATPMGASRPRVELMKDFLMTGDVDGDGNLEVVVFLSESSGGSGTNSYLAVLGRREDEIVNLGTALVGDRVQVRAVRLERAGIELDLVQAGPEDPACCPSQKATRAWALGDSGLNETSTELTGTLSLADLVGPEWILTHLSWDEKAPAGTKVSLVFEAQRVSGTGGCNRYFAQVASRVPGELSVGPIGSTRRACPDEVMDLERRYFKALARAFRYGFLAGRLVLTAQGDRGLIALMFAPESPGS